MTRVKQDHCTLCPDGSWGGCCAKHDSHYLHHDVTRARADMDLARCVWRCGHPLVAIAMWFAVRVCGWWYWRKWNSWCGPMRKRRHRKLMNRRLDHATTPPPPPPGPGARADV